MRRGEIAHNVTRGAFYLAVEKIAALLSGTAYFALLLRWLGPTKYGIMTLALSFTGLATVATGNIEMYLERYAAEYQAQGRLATLRRAQNLALLLKLALGAVAGLALASLAPFVAAQYHTPELRVLLPLLTLMVVFDGFSTTGRATLFGLQQYRWVCALAVAFHILKTLMVGALWFTRQGLPALALGLATLTVAQGVASTVVPMWMLRRARNEGGAAPPRRRALFGEMARYCTPLLGARVTFLSGQNLGKVVLGKLFDVARLGYFSFAFQTMERFVDVVHTLPSSLLPSLTQLVALEQRERLRYVFDQAFRLIQVTGCVLSFGVFVFAREITLLVGSPLFEPAVPLLRVMALVPIARTAQQPLTMLFQALRLPGTVLTLALVKFAGEFSGYFTLVPALGMIGAGVSNLLGAVVSYAMALVFLGRVLPEGARERLRAVGVALVLFVPLLAAGWLLDRGPAFGWSLFPRLALVPLAALALFPLGLITRYDLGKLAALPLGAAWMRVARDRFVAAVDRMARALGAREVA